MVGGSPSWRAATTGSWLAMRDRCLLFLCPALPSSLVHGLRASPYARRSSAPRLPRRSTANMGGSDDKATSSASSSGKAPRNLKDEEVASTKFINLRTITWTDGERERKWDYATRTTRSDSSTADAVSMLPLLRARSSSAPASTLLVLQYRPPFGCHTVELPAGLIDEGETPQKAAERELYEETGFIGVARNVSPVTALSPGMTDELMHNVILDVDLDDPRNKDPEQRLDEGESIEVVRVPLNQLRARLDELASKGYVAFNGVYNVAIGLGLSGQ